MVSQPEDYGAHLLAIQGGPKHLRKRPATSRFPAARQQNERDWGNFLLTSSVTMGQFRFVTSYFSKTTFILLRCLNCSAWICADKLLQSIKIAVYVSSLFFLIMLSRILSILGGSSSVCHASLWLISVFLFSELLISALIFLIVFAILIMKYFKHTAWS